MKRRNYKSAKKPIHYKKRLEDVVKKLNNISLSLKNKIPRIQPKTELDKFSKPIHKDIKIIGEPFIKKEKLNIKKFNAAIFTIKKLIKSKKHKQADKVYYHLVKYYNKNSYTLPNEYQINAYKEIMNTRQELEFAKIRDSII